MARLYLMEDIYDYTEDMERADEFANWLGKMQKQGFHTDMPPAPKTASVLYKQRAKMRKSGGIGTVVSKH